MNYVSGAEVLPSLSIPPEQLMEKLGDPDNGVAYVELPNVNPQGLVDHYADIVREYDHRQSYSYRFEPEPTPHSIAGDPAVTAAFWEHYRQVVFTARDTVRDAILSNLPETGRTAFGNWHEHGLYFRDTPDFQRTAALHSDKNFVSVFLGFSAAGHVINLPDHGLTAVDRLDANHILISRQNYWRFLQLGAVASIRHFNEWQPQNAKDFRILGLIIL